MLRITIVANANAVNMSFAMDAKRNVEALNAQIANNLKETNELRQLQALLLVLR